MVDLKQIQIVLKEIEKSLCQRVDAHELATQNSFKAPFRALLIRETAVWRFHDLLQQIVFLLSSNHVSGAQILLRSAYETMAILVYLNNKMRLATNSVNEYKEFSKISTELLLGSRDKKTSFEAKNVLTMIEKMNKKYPGIQERYNHLSEVSHPNVEAMLLGYSSSDHDGFVSIFENRWSTLYGKYLPAEVKECLQIFLTEYNEEWIQAFENLELWISNNIKELNEASITV